MSTDPKFLALELAVRSGPNATAEGIVKAAEAFHSFLTGTGVSAPVKATKPVKEAAAKVEEKAAVAAAEVVKEEVNTAPAVTQEQIKGAVIKLVEAGNKIAAAGGDASGKVGRQYAAAVLQPFGASNVSTVPADKYADVLAALQAKLAAIEEEAALTG